MWFLTDLEVYLMQLLISQELSLRAHTIGFAQCFTFKRRLSDFKGSGKPDPVLDSSMLQSLKSMCPEGRNSNIAPLDSVSINKFDNVYYKNLMNNTGLLESDQALLDDSKAASMVRYYSMYPYLFSNDFAKSMVKLGNVGVLTGQEGEIRKNCRVLN
ncbi:peroxidase [Ranunculus cassubicifolius]